MRRVVLALVSLSILGCGGPPASKAPAAPSGTPTLITRSATEFGEIELAATVHIEGEDVKLMSPDGSAYAGVMPAQESLENLLLFSRSEETAVGFCFRLPADFPVVVDAADVFLGDKSASYFRLGPRLDGDKPGRFIFTMVSGNFDGRAFTLHVPLKPESMIAQGKWPIEGTVSIADVGRISFEVLEEKQERMLIRLDLNAAESGMNYEVILLDSEGNKVELSSSGSILDTSGYSATKWWRVRQPERAVRFEVWSGRAITAEFSGIALPAAQP